MKRYFLIILLSIISSTSCDHGPGIYNRDPPYGHPDPLYNLSLYVAVRNDNIEEVKRLILILEKNGGYTEFGTIQNTLLVVRSVSMAEFLLSKGADVTVKYLNGGTPLHKAYNVAIAKFLIDNGADVNTKDDDGETALHKARNVAIAKLLIDNGADVNAKNKYGYTPLDEIINEKDKQKLITFLTKVMDEQEAKKP